MKHQEIGGRIRTSHWKWGWGWVQAFVGDRELERANRVSGASTEGNPCRNIPVRAKSEPGDVTAQNMIQA